jgi:hypothetical protein
MSETFPSRREFAAAVALLGVSSLSEGQPSKPDDSTGEAMAALLRVRFGKHLTDEQLKALQGNLHAMRLTAERMKRVKLSNADEPAFTFSADVP